MTDDRNTASQGFAQRVLIPVIRGIAELLLISVVVAAIGVAAYALWDLGDIGAKAQPANWAKYKPGENKLSFDELIKINPEVIGWIQLYGTNVDYPVVQGPDNDKYLTVGADLQYSLTGSIFLDYRNHPDFSDFDNIVYGHSMSYNAMFGDVTDYNERDFYDSHRYGDLYFGGRHHGLRAVGFAKVDGYKTGLCRPLITSAEEKAAFFSELDKSSIYPVNAADKREDATYVLLYTCTSAFTNGRYILVCELTDEVYENTYGEDTRTPETVGGPVLRLQFFLAVMVILFLLICTAIIMRRRDRRKQRIAAERQE